MSLPAVNASLNAVAGLLLCVGLWLVKRGKKDAHARVMIAATCVSAVFLACYLWYHFVVVPEVGHTPFRREGAIRIAYYVMLLTHILLAAVNLEGYLKRILKRRTRLKFVAAGPVEYPTYDFTDLSDNTDFWRQARIPLNEFAGMTNLALRVEYSTAGSTETGADGPS